MAELLDNHAEVLALKFFLRRLIVQQCLSSKDPASAAQLWKEAVEDENQASEEISGELMSKHGPDAFILLTDTCYERGLFADEIVDDVREAMLKS